MLARDHCISLASFWHLVLEYRSFMNFSAAGSCPPALTALRRPPPTGSSTRRSAPSASTRTSPPSSPASPSPSPPRPSSPPSPSASRPEEGRSGGGTLAAPRSEAWRASRYPSPRVSRARASKSPNRVGVCYGTTVCIHGCVRFAFEFENIARKRMREIPNQMDYLSILSFHLVLLSPLLTHHGN